ncbi:hypothetical protein L9F63_022097, partial [Diploptera punctata]
HSPREEDSSYCYDSDFTDLDYIVLIEESVMLAFKEAIVYAAVVCLGDHRWHVNAPMQSYIFFMIHKCHEKVPVMEHAPHRCKHNSGQTSVLIPYPAGLRNLSYNIFNITIWMYVFRKKIMVKIQDLLNTSKMIMIMEHAPHRLQTKRSNIFTSSGLIPYPAGLRNLNYNIFNITVSYKSCFWNFFCFILMSSCILKFHSKFQIYQTMNSRLLIVK